MSESEFWKEKKLDELIQEKAIGLVKGSSLQSDCFEFDYVKMHNISSDNSWNPKGMVRVNATDEEVEKFSLQNNDFLFNTRNSYELVGKSCLYHSTSKIPVLFNNNIMRIKFSTELNPKFAAYAFCSKDASDQLTSMKQGTTGVSGIYYKTLKNLRVKYPPIPEQKRIVAILDQAFADIEQARAKTEQNLKNARELFESYLQQVFSQRGDGWEEHLLGDVCTFKHGFAFKSEFFTQDKGYVLLTPGNFFEEGGYRDRGEKQKYYDGTFPSDFLLSKGDLLVAMTEQAVGLLGSPALVQKGNTFLHNQRLGLVELTNEFRDNLSMEFLFHLFNTKYFRSKVQETATGLKVRHTSPKKMQVIPIWLPGDLNEQKEIALKLFNLKEESLKLEEIYKAKALQLDELKKSILQKAFSGELTKTLEGDANKGAVA